MVSLRKRNTSISTLGARIDGLHQVIDASQGRVDADILDDAQAIVRHADERLALSGEHTVIALAGATGSGKSSLFNALADQQIAVPGVKRPTTSKALAASWGEHSPEALLDWLDIPVRHHMGKGSLDGLVLLDLPDHDSTEVAHRIEVDRLVKLVDTLIWVVDPQKYADAALHHEYLAPMSDYAEVMTVVLNQADRLTEQQLASTMDDLRKILDGEGLAHTKLVAASALTGQGISELRSQLAKTVHDKKARTQRLMADITQVTDRLSEQIGDPVAPHVSPAAVEQLDHALAEAAGVPVVGRAVLVSSRRRGAAATGWPFVSWINRLRPDPLRRLHLDRPLARRGRNARPHEIEPTQIQRTSLNTVTGGVEQARVSSAVRSMAHEAALGLPQGWADAVRTASLARTDHLADDLDQAVAGVDLDMNRSFGWWRFVRVIQWILMAVVIVGLGWLLIDAVLAYAQMPKLPAPSWHGFPLPTLLAGGGALIGVVLGLISRAGVEVSARRTSRQAEQRLIEALDGVSDRDVIDPIEAELALHDQAYQGIQKARGRR